MPGSGKKWLTGCGVGCLAAIVLLLALLGGGMLLFKDTFVGWREATAAKEELGRTQGEIGDFQPAWDGSLGADRVAAFLRVQERCADSGIELVTGFLQARHGFQDSSNKLGRIWKTIRSGTHLGPLMAEFTRARSEALLTEDMNPGEYLFLHSLVYHCWLGYEPAGNAERFFGPGNRDGGRHTIYVGGDINLAGDPREVALQLRRRLNDRHRMWLRSILRAAPATVSPQEQIWLDAVGIELASLVEDPAAVPWDGPFPQIWQDALEPLRSSLTAGWSDEIDLLELIMQQ